jgi:hypothetical protein
MSRSIGEPLAHDTFNSTFGALNVINAKPHAVAISEIEFANITMQVLLTAMLIDAFHTALEDTEVAFNGVCMHIATDIFFVLVADAFMAGEMTTKRIVTTPFISHHRGFFRDIGLDNRHK